LDNALRCGWKRFMLKLYKVLLIGICLVHCGCATIYNPATEQKELIFITTPTEVSLGNTIASQINQQFKISSDTKKISRVKEIGKKIADVSDRKDLIYHFNIVEDDELNAFTTPGGHVYVNSGVVDKTTDDELACAIGHEIGHIAARHIAKKMQAQIGYDILMNIALRKGGIEEFQQAVSLGYNLVMLGYSREDELMADRLGVKYAYKAGYDPYAMITFLKKIQSSKEEELGFVFLRSHPYISQRIKMLEMQIPAVKDKVDNKVFVQNKPIQQQTNQGITPTVESIDKRPLRVMCPVCRRIFSGRTRYCPYDGAKLQ
jgi:predicted Zn-dependent protease